ncbi:MAG: hypothetical protein AUG44_23880 [Actinobacteria bacterium 13_1_20CM_3_71_11]|nr:MAG: hypothetical protein AUG44_23880 [Actinobacteria bacterium 13_1_20CM_3_71_11]
MRSLAIGLLVMSLVGGYWLSTDRKTQQHDAVMADAQRSDFNDLYQQKLDAAAQWRANAGQRAAQADARAAADAAAKAAADQAKAADDAARKQQEASRGGNRPPPPATPGVPIPTSCAQFTGNQAMACAILPQFGYGLDQMNCLVPMWTKESHWNEKARNPSSGAYGIAQALPASKYAAYGADYLTNPVPQIKWGINYTKAKYGSPCAAWGYWQKHGWY